MKTTLHAAGAIALLSIAWLGLILAQVAHRMSHQAEQLRVDVDAQITAARVEATRQIEATSKDVLVRSERQVTAARNDLMSFMEHSAELANNRAGEALSTVHTGMALANGQINGIREDLKPVLVNHAALTKDVQDSIDDLYWEVKSSVESATVFATSGALMADDARAALPKLLATGEAIGENVEGITGDFHGITTDAHTFTSKFTAPRTKKQKAWDTIQTILLLGGRAALSR